jgi:signal transduction histidine kinase
MGARVPMPGSEAALLRRTRLRLIAWSGGSTLVVLLVLGVAIYAATAASLAASATAQLRDRMTELRTGLAQHVSVGPLPAGASGGATYSIGVTADPGMPGVLVGGTSSGTIAFMVETGPGSASAESTGPASNQDAAVVAPVPGGPEAISIQSGAIAVAPDPGLIADALAQGLVVREATIVDAPVRVMASSVMNGSNQFVAVVIGDRSAEVGTLTTLLAVLLGGGFAVLAAAIALGYVYAGRALVPIRESLRRQREFAADASHELRTPLAINRAAIAELRRGRDDPAIVDRAINDLDAGAARLESLVDDLLLLARTDAGAVELDMADTDLALAAAEASETLEPVAAAHGVRLVLDVVPAPMRGDEARLRQLARILVDNAIRHSPDGGRVTVSVRPGTSLVVEDEGPGVDEAHLEAIFERFWRAPGAPAGGTGLGLAIGRWIAERHGGSVQAERRDGGQGARFVVRLPAG